jgi:hypothetical protein
MGLPSEKTAQASATVFMRIAMLCFMLKGVKCCDHQEDAGLQPPAHAQQDPVQFRSTAMAKAVSIFIIMAWMSLFDSDQVS